MTDEKEEGLSPFEAAIKDLALVTGKERDKAIWNAALSWAAQNAYMEVVDEFAGKITETKLESMDLMDEIYQVSKLSILSAIEG